MHINSATSPGAITTPEASFAHGNRGAGKTENSAITVSPSKNVETPVTRTQNIGRRTPSERTAWIEDRTVSR